MNTQKYKMENCGLLREADRSMYEKKDSASRSLIDKNKSKDNYNLCRHAQYTPGEIKAIQERIRGKKMRKDAVAFGSTIITLPKDFEGDPEKFFQAAYRGLKSTYRLREQDIVSAYVHMDESTPHMHFYFIPVHREENRESISWDKVFPRAMYQKQHQELQEYISATLGVSVELLNEKTLGIDNINKLTKEQKREAIEAREAVQEAQRERKEVKADIESFLAMKEQEIADLKQEVTTMQERIESYEKRELELLDKISELELKSKELGAMVERYEAKLQALSKKEENKYPRAPLSRDKYIVPEEDMDALIYMQSNLSMYKKRMSELEKREANLEKLERQAQNAINAYNRYPELNQELRQEQKKLREEMKKQVKQEINDIFDALELPRSMLQRAYKLMEQTADYER